VGDLNQCESRDSARAVSADERSVGPMHLYRFCAALRHLDGTLDAPAREESIMARNADEAIEVAKRIHVDMVGTGTNSIYLTDPAGHVIWSLRLGELWLDRDC
jgi:hypothetical protein